MGGSGARGLGRCGGLVGAVTVDVNEEAKFFCENSKIIFFGLGSVGGSGWEGGRRGVGGVGVGSDWWGGSGWM